MSTAQQALADAVETNAELLTRYLVDFDDQTHVAQAPGLPNHVIWTLGHCSLTMQRAAELADGQPVSRHDFREDAAPPNNRIPMRFYTETVCFGSTPAIDPLVYPSIESGMLIYNRSCERLAEAVRSCSDEALDAEHDWGATRLPFRALIGRVIFHNGMHAGQIANLRRALGLPSIFQSGQQAGDRDDPMSFDRTAG
ncbi:MAG: DinB family protein [Planctomycetota bacterium]